MSIPCSASSGDLGLRVNNKLLILQTRKDITEPDRKVILQILDQLGPKAVNRDKQNEKNRLVITNCAEVLKSLQKAAGSFTSKTNIIPILHTPTKALGAIPKIGLETEIIGLSSLLERTIGQHLQPKPAYTYLSLSITSSLCPEMELIGLVLNPVLDLILPISTMTLEIVMCEVSSSGKLTLAVGDSSKLMQLDLTEPKPMSKIRSKVLENLETNEADQKILSCLSSYVNSL